VIDRFLADNREFTLHMPTDLPEFARPSERGWVRILPGMLEEDGGLDGFFMARLVRRT
jgi:16S rRNA (cytosine967-C5)-methyltransferase